MRSPCLEQVEDDRWGDPPAEATYLVSTVHVLRRKPLGELNAEDLRIMIGQQVGLPVLVPLAVERLRRDPLEAGDFYRGDLLASVLRVDPSFWDQHPVLHDDVRAVISELDEVPAEELDGLVRTFLTE
jgi:hypothetical protein